MQTPTACKSLGGTDLAQDSLPHRVHTHSQDDGVDDSQCGPAHLNWQKMGDFTCADSVHAGQTTKHQRDTAAVSACRTGVTQAMPLLSADDIAFLGGQAYSVL